MHPYLANFLAGLLLTAASALALGFFVFLTAPGHRLNQIYALFCAAIFLWSAFESWLVVAPTAPLALLFERIEHLGVVYIPVLFLHYALLLAEKSAPRSLKANYLIATGFALLLPTNLIVNGLDGRPELGLRYFVEPGIGYWVMMLWFFVPVSCGFHRLWYAYRTATGARKNQLKYVFWGGLIGFFGGCGNYLYVYDVELPWFNPNSTYGVPIYMGMTAYAIVRHRLMDINVVLKKTLIYTLLYSACLAVFGFVVYVLGQWWLGIDPRWTSLLGIMLVVAMVRPLDIFLTRLTDRIFFRERTRYTETLRKASVWMGRVRHLPKLLTLIVRAVVNNIRVAHASIFLRDLDQPGFRIVASRGRMRKQKGLFLEERNPLIDWLARHPEPVVYEELKARLKRQPQKADNPLEIRQLSQVGREMERLRAAVCVPSLMEGKLKGFLMLGEKLSGDMYAQEDLDMFTALAKQAAMAVENAEAYEELRNTRDQLVQAERLSTIGRFAADMAHEIKNPLQALKTFFELLPMKYDRPDFREGFSQIARQEVERIDHFVRQLATYTNPKPPKFQTVELHQVVDGVLALLENDIANRRIELRKGYSRNGLTVEADRDQMKQVFLNLVMNSVEAMSPEEGKTNQLEIIAYPDGKTLVAKVRDTGCGIPPERLSSLFTPFTSTKEKGTGLGLSIVQSILWAHHGDVKVESEVGRGTTITITLPRRQTSSGALSQVA